MDPVQLRRHIAYFLLYWQNDYLVDLTGERLPFDQPSLVLYERCAKLYRCLHDLLNRRPELSRAQPTLVTVCNTLAPVHDSPALVAAADRLRKAVDLFTELRDALRFKRQDGRPVRRDRAPDFSPETARQTELRLAALRARLGALTRLGTRPDSRHDAQIVLDYIERYWDKLFGHLIELPGERRPVLVDRPNDICEQHFNRLKRGWRRRIGTEELARQLQAARHEELLVANLTDERYVQAIYGGSLDNLADRFADATAKAQERRCARRDATDRHVIPITRKALRKPRAIQRVCGMLRRIADCLP